MIHIICYTLKKPPANTVVPGQEESNHYTIFSGPPFLPPSSVNIFLSSPFPSSLSLYSSVNGEDQAPHPYKNSRSV